MKYITIGAANIDDKKEAIEKALEEVQKGCRARKIDFYDVKRAIRDINNDCPVKAKTARAGIRFSVDPNGQPFPNAYMKKGRPQSTIISGEFSRSGMKILFSRDDAYNTTNAKYSDYNKEQAFRLLEDAGCDTYYLTKAINLYENQTGIKVLF